MDTVGPLARSASDIAAALDALAGHQPKDMTSADEPTADYLAALRRGACGLVIGAPQKHMEQVLDPEIHAAWRATLERLTQAGAEVREISLPNTDDAMTIWPGLVVGDTVLWHDAPLQERGDGYSDRVKMLIEGARGATATEVAQARKDQWRLKRAFLDAIAGVDLFILLGAPVTAPLDSEIEDNALTSGARKVGGEVMLEYALPFNVTGLPAMIVPLGRAVASGMPLAVMVCAGPFGEDRILRAAAAIEAFAGFDVRPDRYR